MSYYSDGHRPITLNNGTASYNVYPSRYMDSDARIRRNPEIYRNPYNVNIIPIGIWSYL